MNKEEFEFLLFDRIEKIKSLSEQYDLSKTYISHSGGKDSCVLSKLIDLALPNNNIPRVYKNTGIEYPQMVKFVKKIAEKDNRFIIIPPNKNIKKTLAEVGYPFKSKQHSNNFKIYKNNIDECENYKQLIINSGIMKRIEKETYTKDDVELIANLPRGTKTFIKYYFGIRERELESQTILYIFEDCPKKLRYQFEPYYAKTHNWSDNCCREFKHGVLSEWENDNGFINCFTGMRKEEGGNRDKLTCITNGKNGKHFNVLVPITDEWEREFIKKYNLELCELYFPPYNFVRTGCMFCPFKKDLQKDLDIIKKANIKLFKQANHIWDTSYNEYRKIGYRLRKEGYCEQTSIFDYIDEN